MSSSSSTSTPVYISEPVEFTEKDEKKYLNWIGGGPGSDEDTDEDVGEDLKGILGYGDEEDDEVKEKYHRWVAETLGANSDDEYTNQYLDDDDD